MKKEEEKWSVFWCNLLSPVLYGDISERNVNKFLKEVCNKEFLFPDSQLKRPSLSTLRRKLKKYQDEGFNSLKRKLRNDIGKIRKFKEEILFYAIDLKKENPSRSADSINYALQNKFNKQLPSSTLYRLLKQSGATRQKLGYTKTPVRKRWTKDNPNDMWIGDVEEGPYVKLDNKSQATYLSAFIDVNSRYIVTGRYYYRQNTDVLIDCLLNGWIINGIPKAIYVDNAKIYHSNQLKASCFKLLIKLIHRKAGDPAPGGLIERFFKTVQDQFENEVRAGNILTLEELNIAFSAWLEQRYHKKVHSAIKETPENVYKNENLNKRYISLSEAQESFLLYEIRKVNKDFSDIVLFNKYYLVDEKLRGDKVKVYYNPIFSIDKVKIHDLNNVFLCQGILHNREKGKKISSQLSLKTNININDIVIKEHEKYLKTITSPTIDYCKLTESRIWPYSSFVQLFSELLGRKGGYSSFTANEHEKLKKTYNIRKDINELLLKKAFEVTYEVTFSNVIFALRKLLQNKEN